MKGVAQNRVIMDTNDPFVLLKENNLFGEKLFDVYDIVNIERYNACLAEIGIEPTALKRFTIDGIGYSPEIAAEKSDPDYLSHGGISNPYGIILSPQQEGLPICHPYYSFYEGVMNEVFRTFRGQLTDLTLRTACYLKFDEGFTTIDLPRELLLVEGIIVRFTVIGSVAEFAKRQREICSLLMKDQHWADNMLINELKENIETYGDLRYQRMQLTNLPFMQVRSFYTPVFGGTYIFRSTDLEGHILICMDNEHIDRIQSDHSEYRFGDPDLYEKLEKHKLIDLQSEYYRTDVSTEKLERLAECIFVDALTKDDDTVDILNLTEGKRAKRIQRLLKEDKLSPIYEELLMLAHKSHLRRKTAISKTSKELKKLLAYPHSQIKGMTRLVTHRLLVHLWPVDILDLFVYAKDIFLELYAGWPENKKKWAVELLKRNLPQKT